MDFAYPFRVDVRGRTAAAASYDDHVHDMIEQLLFTSPGERVMRPDFGQRPAPARLCAEQRGGGCDDAVPRAGCAATVARRPHRGFWRAD